MNQPIEPVLIPCPTCEYAAPDQLKLLTHRLNDHKWKPHFYRNMHGPYRVMVAVDGYVMARYPHAMPFVLSYKELLRLLGRDATDE